ncbi:L-rhamnose mutarotase [Filimonas lacunae]|uniref:L-rhamnose mutarotase n=1 Tax=Filimonas lacunae TaxID=477680 RepID=A0A173MAL7_9BACT|nr:L-rhamnose mutarotase [Filimonas lacunae]BAV04508.1 L-fucose mutarotase, type 2 [Filimonas lacunae]SIT31625.1 L-rhamnose mutarotase [Filimonas lacunae]
MNNKRCFALDLVDDVKAIAEYEAYHQQVWPEILQSITQAGITDMEIYRAGNRLFMIMTVSETFDAIEKAAADAANAKVQEWETLMGKYQQAIPAALPGEKWTRMNRIFSLASQWKQK